jgi:hypothetical protein
MAIRAGESAPEPDILNYWKKDQLDIQLRHIIAIHKAKTIQMKQVTSSSRAQPPGTKVSVYVKL